MKGKDSELLSLGFISRFGAFCVVSRSMNLLLYIVSWDDLELIQAFNCSVSFLELLARSRSFFLFLKRKFRFDFPIRLLIVCSWFCCYEPLDRLSVSLMVVSVKYFEFILSSPENMAAAVFLSFPAWIVVLWLFRFVYRIRMACTMGLCWILLGSGLLCW